MEQNNLRSTSAQQQLVEALALEAAKSQQVGQVSGALVGQDPLAALGLTAEQLAAHAAATFQQQQVEQQGTVASKSPLPGGFWVFLGSSRKGLAEIDRGFRVLFRAHVFPLCVAQLRQFIQVLDRLLQPLVDRGPLADYCG